MAAAGGSKGPPTVAGRTQSFAELVSVPPQPIPEVVVPFRSPQVGRFAYSFPGTKLRDRRPCFGLLW